MKPKIIGLTGPIASGKNEVAAVLRRRGAYVIDADDVGHRLLVPQSETWKKVIKTFGSKILMAGGRINLKSVKSGDVEHLKRRLSERLLASRAARAGPADRSGVSGGTL